MIMGSFLFPPLDPGTVILMDSVCGMVHTVRNPFKDRGVNTQGKMKYCAESVADILKDEASGVNKFEVSP